MPVQEWDDETLVVRLSDDPVLSDDMAEVNARQGNACYDVVLDMSDVGLLTSSGISSLLRLRKRVKETGRRLILCAPQDPVWGVFLSTGLDTIFDFAENVAHALTRLKSEQA